MGLVGKEQQRAPRASQSTTNEQFTDGKPASRIFILISYRWARPVPMLTRALNQVSSKVWLLLYCSQISV